MSHPARLDTYTGYSLGCAAVWTAIVGLARRRDPRTRETVQLVCSSWWAGWTSATIARLGYPPPRALTAEGKARLERVSVGLVALGFASVARLLAGRAGGDAG